MDIPVYLQIREYPRCSDAPGNSANSEWITLSRCQPRPTRLQVKIMFCHGKTLVRSLNYDQPLRHTRKTPRCSRAPPKAHRINPQPFDKAASPGQKKCFMPGAAVPNPMVRDAQFHMGVSKNRGTPKIIYFWKTLLKWMILGVPLFLETPTWALA